MMLRSRLRRRLDVRKPAVRSQRPTFEVVERRVLCAAGFAVTPITGLVTTGAGGTATYTVALTQVPKANVTVPIASSNTAAGTVSPTSLVFTPSNWSTPQSITVTGVNDHIAGGNTSYSALNQSAVSTDASYSGLNPADVSVTNINIDASSIAGLRAMNPTTVGVADLLGYATPGDGGGGMFTWSSTSTAADNAGTVVAPAGYTASTPGRWLRQYGGAIDVRWFGATGNGTTDDTAALQGALTAAAATPGGATVNAAPGATYLVSYAGNKVVIQGTGPYFQRYCLSIGPGTTFNLEGSTLALAAGSDASILINQDPDYATSSPDANITVTDGILNSNGANQAAPSSGSMAALYLSNGTHLAATYLTFNNVCDMAMYWQGVSNSTANALVCNYSEGNGFDFGFYSPTATYDGRVTSSTIGPIEADNCQAGLFSSAYQGNPVVITATSTTFASIVASDDASAIKVGDGSAQDTITKAVFAASAGAARTATNWAAVGGFRLQGTGAGHDPQGISVGEVDASNCYGPGLYIENAEGCKVSTYVGTANAQVGNNPDVWLGTGTGDSLGTVESYGSYGEGLLIRPAAAGFSVATAVVANPSQNGTAQPAVELEGSSGTLGQVVASDSTGEMRYGLAVFNTTPTATVGGVICVGATTGAVRDGATGVSVGPVVSAPSEAVAGAITEAVVTPTSGLTTTESGGTATFQVVLTQPPVANVTVPVASSSSQAATTSAAALTFTPANWDVPQSITVTGVHNAASDRNQSYQVSVGPLSGGDGSFAGLTLPSVSLANLNIDAFNVADLRTLSPGVVATAAVPCYATPGDGGGGTFTWSATSTAADNAGTVVAPAGYTASTPGRWLRQYSGAIDVRWFGARGDGVTNDTAALQGALNAAAATPGGAAVVAAPGATYLVSYAGSKTVIQGAGPYFQRYCLSIAPGTTFNLEGSTLSLAAGSDASILINQDPDYATSSPDANITVTDGTLDSNEASEAVPSSGCMSAIYFSNGTNMTVTSVTFTNQLDLAMYWVGVSSSSAGNLVSTSSQGSGFFFGLFLPTESWNTLVTNSTFGSIIAENCQNGLVMSGSAFLEGNPIIMDAVNCTLSYMEADDCGGGLKVTDASSHVSITKAVFNGASGSARTASNATNNSGLKIQGNGAGYDPQDITVGEVDASNCVGSGLYIENATNSTVTTYNGSANGQNAANPDVWIGTGSGDTVTTINSTEAYGEAVLVRPGATHFTIGTATIVNPSQVEAAQPGLEVEGTNGTITKVVASDSTGKMRYGLAVFNATASATINSVQATGATDAPVRQQSPAVTILAVITDPNSPLTGTVSPVAGQTPVANVNPEGVGPDDPSAGGGAPPIDEPSQSPSPPSDEAATGLVLARYLRFTSKVTGTAAKLGYRMRTARDPATARRLIEQSRPRLILIDLTAAGLANVGAIEEYRRLAGPSAWLVAVGPHVDTERLAAARNAGCQLALPRSKFSADLPGLLRRCFDRPADADEDRE